MVGPFLGHLGQRWHWTGMMQCCQSLKPSPVSLYPNVITNWPQYADLWTYQELISHHHASSIILGNDIYIISYMDNDPCYCWYIRWTTDEHYKNKNIRPIVDVWICIYIYTHIHMGTILFLINHPWKFFIYGNINHPSSPQRKARITAEEWLIAIQSSEAQHFGPADG